MNFSPIAGASSISLTLMMLSFFLTFLRLARGPSAPDRIVALDLIAIITIGTIVSFIFLTGEVVFLYAAVVLALVAFLGTVAYAKFLERRSL
ncbi:MAG: monovalent cation/H+ antiporter complex subunit F [candidate division KSB1 bacterium]|nr:monovalent cation/H+ antiporter complex subunit F [candidate division KSB1 bacterium]